MIRNLRSRALAIVLLLVLCLGLLPATVFAVEDYKITVSGIQVTSENANDVLGNGTVSYDHETKTLTLNNADLGGGILISQEKVVNISIQGNNKITSDQYGIVKNAYPNDPAAPAGLFVSGPGSLEVTAQTNGIEAYRELVMDNVDLTINAQQFSFVSQDEGELIIKNGSNITATSDAFPTMVGGEIEISDSKTDATSNASEVNVLYASSGNISIENSNVKATATSKEAYPAICAAGDITITDSNNVEAISSGAQGISTGRDMTVTNSTVSAESTGEAGISVTGGTLSLTNSELSATTFNPSSFWAIVTGHLNVINSEATAKGGLYLYGNLSVTPADGKLMELKVGSNWDGSKAEHFSDGVKSPYDAAVNFNADEQQAISSYGYVHIGEHIHIGGTATCEDPAVCEDCGRPYGNALGHSYSEPVWNWSADGKTCTVTFTCSNDETHKETPEVKVTSAVRTPATCTETGVTTYTATVEFNGQIYMDTKDVADIPATSHSYENGKCTVCGAIDPNFTPEIIAGANGTWQKGTQDGLSFTSNAAFDDFIKVQVDGKDLDASNYTTKEGSTIVTLKASYLETLSVGKHTLAIVSDTGKAETEFTILAASNSDESLVQTGDNNMSLVALLSIIGAMSAVIGVVALRKSRL